MYPIYVDQNVLYLLTYHIYTFVLTPYIIEDALIPFKSLFRAIKEHPKLKHEKIST